LRSYIKIVGPPVLEAVKALERIAVDMPEVCIMDTVIVKGISPDIARDVGLEPRRRPPVSVPSPVSTDWVRDYFDSSGVPVSQERCESIISESGSALGEYDFFFEWFEKPSMSQLNDLIMKIDEALSPLGCLYTITSK